MQGLYLEHADILVAGWQYTADVEMTVKLAQQFLRNSRVNLQRGGDEKS
jgi:hypothetical protein